jgi:outer membrane protein
MIRFKLSILVPVALLIAAPYTRAQLSKVVWVDFERAVVESAEGKKSSDKFNGALKAKQADVEKRQKDLEEAQKKLQNGARTLSDAAKAELQKDIDKKTTDLQRINEDAQKELQTLRDELLRPIAERATALLSQMAEEQGYTLVVDTSNPQSNVIWANPKNDITADLIKSIDAATPKEPAAKTEAPKTTAPAATRTPAPAPPQKP